MIFKDNLIVILIFLISCLSMKAQEKINDDQRPKMEENQLRKELLKEGHSAKETEKIIQKTREIYKKYYLGKKSGNEKKVLDNVENKATSSLNRMANESCINMGFETGDFSGWCRKTGLFANYSQTSGYIVSYDDGLICNNDIINDDTVYTAFVNGDTIPTLIECTIPRFSIISNTDSDSNGIDLTQITETFAVKLGNTCVRNKLDRIQQTFIVNETNTTFGYHYAVAFQDTGTCTHIGFESPSGCPEIPNPDHPIINHWKPYFTIYLEIDGVKIECSEYLIFGDERIFDFRNVNGVFVKDWSSNSLDLLQFVNIGDEVTVVAEVSDCGLGGHFGYAYFEASCGGTSNEVQISANPGTSACTDQEITFSSTGGTSEYYWTIFNNDNGEVIETAFTATTTFTFLDPGYYRVTYSLPTTGTTGQNCFGYGETLFIDIEDCNGSNETCEGCDSFSPDPGKKYWLGAWVKEEHLNQNEIFSYQNASIDLVFSNSNNQPISTITLNPSGEIIEGWQRIIGEFTIPQNTIYLNLTLVNNSNSISVYFDDVRVHPFNGNMKSFAYDSENYRLMGELDENNYTTFYEYDNEGGLVRVKKETERGVFTIQETRSSNPKKQ